MFSSTESTTFRYLDVAWGRYLIHPITTLDLMALPLTFTQNELLSPQEFVDQAKKRGVPIRPEQLLELHRHRLLVPFFQLSWHPDPNVQPVPVALVAQNRYSQLGTAIARVIEAAEKGYLNDPVVERFWSWEDGLPFPTTASDLMEHYKVFYSPYQLLGLRGIDALCRRMSEYQDTDKNRTFTLQPVNPDIVDTMETGRRLAILLSGLDSHYLPQIVLVAHHSPTWEQEDPGFIIADRLKLFSLDPEQLANTAENLLQNARNIDPMGAWYELIRQAHPDTWETLSGDARLAIDYRVAAEILLKAVDDLGWKDLSTPPPRLGRMVHVILDDRLRPDRAELDEALTRRGLSPQPSLLLVLEGDTEFMIMPRVIHELYGRNVPRTLIEFANMQSVDRDLDLLLRHVLSPLFGQNIGNVILFTRPPTRILVVVDPENKYQTPEMQEKERSKLVRRLFETLSKDLQTTASQAEIDTLVEVDTWGTEAWEFANFTDRELAEGIFSCVAPPSGMDMATLTTRIENERARTSSGSNIDKVMKDWPKAVKKVELAEALWPTLRQKIHRLPISERCTLPAVKVGVQALDLALKTPRRNVALRIK